MKQILILIGLFIGVIASAQIQDVSGTVQDWSVHRGVMNDNFDYLDEKIDSNSNFAVTNAGRDVVGLGAELLTNYSFDGDLSGWTAGAGWAYGNNGAQHTAGNTATLTQSITLSSGGYFVVRVYNSNRTTGNVTITMQGFSGYINTVPWVDFGITTEYLESSTYIATAGTYPLTLTPGTTYDGTLDSVSIRRIGDLVPSVTNYYDNSGDIYMGVRGDSSKQNVYLSAFGGEQNYSGFGNFAFGINILDKNISGYDNCAFGIRCLQNNYSGVKNSCFGVNAGAGNTTGVQNTYIGFDAGVQNTTGNGNVGIGVDAMYKGTTSYRNTAIGNFVLDNIVAGSYDNVVVGYQGGMDISSINLSTLIGPYTGTGSPATGLTNTIMLGFQAGATKSNQAVIGNASIVETVVRGTIVLTPQAAAPSTPAEGWMYYDSTTHKLMVYDGTTWQACW